MTLKNETVIITLLYSTQRIRFYVSKIGAALKNWFVTTKSSAARMRFYRAGMFLRIQYFRRKMRVQVQYYFDSGTVLVERGTILCNLTIFKKVI